MPEPSRRPASADRWLDLLRSRALDARGHVATSSLARLRRLGDACVAPIARSVAEQLLRQRLDMSSVVQELALRDSARFVLENVPLHLGKTHFELRRDAVLAAQEGLFLEFGVWRGHWLRTMARLRDVPFYGFDSFEGLPEAWSTYPQGYFDLGGNLPEMPPNVTLVKGWFSDTLPRFLKEEHGEVAFAHIDCDLYSSTRTVLELLAPRLVPGTQLVLDDFMYVPGWQREEHRAFFEFISAQGWDFEYTGYATEFPACSAGVKLIRRR